MLILNSLSSHRQALEAADASYLDAAAAAQVHRYLQAREDPTPTPLRALPGLARRLAIGGLYVKDEGARLGLGSFKALGGGYAVTCAALERAGQALDRVVTMEALEDPEVRAPLQTLTFVCATDGNHGRSVARAAQKIGAQARILVHAGVSLPRIAAMERYGAQVEVLPGDYDATVAAASRYAQTEGWSLLSDTSWPGYERVPALVMQGYLAVIDEALRAAPHAYTHVFVQAGVGGLAAAIAGHLALQLPGTRPVFIVVEPERAACVQASAIAGQLSRAQNRGATIMGMLECFEPSLVAWRILSRVADAFMTLDEDEAPRAMRVLAYPRDEDPVIVSGESGCAGLAGLLRIASASPERARLGLDGNAQVLVINTEEATDPALYARLIQPQADDPAV